MTGPDGPPTATRDRPRPDGWIALLALALVVGLLLRLPSFHDSLNSDELSTYFDVTGRSLGGTLDLVRGTYEVTPPLYLLLANLTQGLGDPQDALRLVPFACGLLAIPLTWILGALTMDRRAATVAAGAVAVSPFLVFYSTEARAYSLMMVLVLGSTIALWQALHPGPGGRHRVAWWLLYAGLTCAAIYTHYTAAFVLAAQAGWALAAHRGAWRYLVAANAAAALAWLPWLSSYRADQANPASSLIGFLFPFDLASLKTSVLHWAVGHPLTTASVRDFPGRTSLALIALGVAVAVAAKGWELRRPGAAVPRWAEGPVLVVVLALATPVLAAVYSAVGESVYLSRNLIASSPGLALTLAAIVTSPRARLLWIPGAALLLAGLAVGGVRMTLPETQRPDYKDAARFILMRGGEHAVVVDVPGRTPGALTHLEVAADPGHAVPRHPTILRLGRSSQADELRESRPGGGGQFAVLKTTPPAQVARTAVRLARGHEIFLVRSGRPEDAAPELQAFLRALPAGSRAVTSRHFPGFFGFVPVTVTVLAPG